MMFLKEIHVFKGNNGTNLKYVSPIISVDFCFQVTKALDYLKTTLKIIHRGKSYWTLHFALSVQVYKSSDMFSWKRS